MAHAFYAAPPGPVEVSAHPNPGAPGLAKICRRSAAAGMWRTVRFWQCRRYGEAAAGSVFGSPLGGSFLSGSSTARRASRTWSPKVGPPPTKTRATFPSRSMITVCGIAVAAYFPATAPSIEGHGHVQLVPLQHRGDLLGGLLQVDRNE